MKSQKKLLFKVMKKLSSICLKIVPVVSKESIKEAALVLSVSIGLSLLSYVLILVKGIL